MKKSKQKIKNNCYKKINSNTNLKFYATIILLQGGTMLSYFIFTDRHVSKEHLYPDMIVSHMRDCKVTINDFYQLQDKLSSGNRELVCTELLNFCKKVCGKYLYVDIRTMSDVQQLKEDIKRTSGYRSGVMTQELGEVLIAMLNSCDEQLREKLKGATQAQKWRQSVKARA